MRLHFKFSSEIASDDRQRLLQELLERGATAAFQMFEDEDDPEAASLYVVETDDEESEERVFAALEEAEQVEFVERPVRRGLIW